MNHVESPRRRLGAGRALWVALLLGAAGRLPAAGAAEARSPAALVQRWKDAIGKATPEAFAKVVEDYRTEKDETLRGLLVSTVCDAATTDADVARLRAWRERSAGPTDTWLWYRTLLREYERAPADVRDVAAGDGCCELRAAAIRALAAWADPDALDLVPAAVRRQWGEGRTGALQVEAWAAVVAGQPGRAGTAAFRAAVNALAEYCETQGPDARTKLEVGRSLARAFESDAASTDPLVWRSLLERVDTPADPHHVGHTAGATTTFFDLDATGDRVVYLLDASGSMSDPLDDATLASVRKLASAGRATVAGVTAIDWSKVTTKAQAVAEVTKQSIRTLRPTMSFCVVLFGEKPQPLATTPGLVLATPQNVAAACRDLDAAKKAGGRGKTNLHGGLRRAFGVTLAADGPARGGTADEAEGLLLRGATTMFVLSDGVPSRDDWDDTMNTVTGKPWFAEAPAIVEDVARMNLLRGCEVHAVSLGGEARSVLAPLARAGGGHVRTVGAPDDAPVVTEVSVDVLAPGPFRRAVEQRLARIATQGPEGDGARAGLRGLLTNAASPLERIWIAHRLATVGDRNELATLLAGVEDPSPEIATLADAGLAKLSGRSFGGAAGLRREARTALRRNWTWWFESHPSTRDGR